MRQGLFAVLCGAVLLASCGSQSSVPAPSRAEIDYAARAEPPSPALAAIFERSCKTCHSVVGTGAPLVGHAAAWAPRLAERGPDGLLASAKNGRNAMPAGGMCPDCADDDYRRIIAFMSTKPNAEVK